METRNLRVIFNKSGGTAGKNSYTTRVTLPKTWLDKIGVTIDDREVTAVLIDNQIVIEKTTKE